MVFAAPFEEKHVIVGTDSDLRLACHIKGTILLCYDVLHIWIWKLYIITSVRTWSGLLTHGRKVQIVVAFQIATDHESSLTYVPICANFHVPHTTCIHDSRSQCWLLWSYVDCWYIKETGWRCLTRQLGFSCYKNPPNINKINSNSQLHVSEAPSALGAAAWSSSCLGCSLRRSCHYRVGAADHAAPRTTSSFRFSVGRGKHRANHGQPSSCCCGCSPL